MLLGKGVHPCDCIDEWEKCNETSLPVKEELYSNLNMENTTNVDYMHTKKVCEDF